MNEEKNVYVYVVYVTNTQLTTETKLKLRNSRLSIEYDLHG